MFFAARHLKDVKRFVSITPTARCGWCHVALMLAAGATALFGQEPEKPNVLFIIADDLGVGDLACYGNPVLRTPNIDALAKAGVRLTNHYAPSPLCAPSRAGFLTGRYNHRTGAVDVPSNRGLDRLAFSEQTFGDLFRSAGYRTALIGKWHNGLYCRDHLPHRRGFDSFIGFPNGGQDYWKWNLLRNDQPFEHDGRYLSDVLNEETIQFIRASRKANTPFAIFLAHHAPHPPLQAPRTLINKYQRLLGNHVTKQVATTYAMIEAMDRGLGRVFDAMKSESVWENTIIVFTSDNGAQLGKIDGGSVQRFHSGLRGNKGDVGEQGIRVPAIVVWHNRIPAGRTVDVPLHGCDWLPTLFSQTRSVLPSDANQFDGMNVMPTLQGELQPGLALRCLAFQKNRYYPVAHSDAAIRQGRWKLTWPGIPSTMSKQSARDNPSYLRGLSHPHWEMPLDRGLQIPKTQKSISDPSPTLFDLDADPGEKRNLAESHPELVTRLTSTYDTWFRDVMKDWQHSRKKIVEHDRAYWRDRKAPDPIVLFEDYWLWNRAPDGTNPNTSDPLKTFEGFWNNP